jgi:CelD/BcsL family acetyltransferase involved in cellulose biosynthesis
VDRALWDRLALASPDIDRFCSASAWGLAAMGTIMEPGELVLEGGGDGLIALAHRRRDGLSLLEGLEASWGLGSPLIGPDRRGLAATLSSILAGRSDWELAVLPGLPLGSPLLGAVAATLADRFRLATGPLTRRHVASLAGGVDGFLGRRSAGTRKSLRRAARRAAAAGISFEAHRPRRAAELDALITRAVAVEARSWKRRDGGLAIPGMRRFYFRLGHRLIADGRLRVLVASLGDEDVAYVLGAVFGDTYRGLQFSFDDRYRDVGLGNLAQLRQIEQLVAEPEIRTYDLGTGGAYKRAWAELTRDSVCLVAIRA